MKMRLGLPVFKDQRICPRHGTDAVLYRGDHPSGKWKKAYKCAECFEQIRHALHGEAFTCPNCKRDYCKIPAPAMMPDMTLVCDLCYSYFENNGELPKIDS